MATLISCPNGLTRVVVILIKPSSYCHHDQFVLRGWRQAIPCNSLAVLHALTIAALQQLLPSTVTVEVHLLEESILAHAHRLEQLQRRFPQRGTRLIVGLVGVQTLQFARASDVVKEWQSRGATVVIGGFHVSGSISTLHDGVDDSKRNIPCPGVMPPEIQALLDRGVIVFHGEAEDAWQAALTDIIRGSPQPLYRGGKPALTEAPLPQYHDGYHRTGFVSAMYTLDTGRGCPFTCSFCSIINVQGRQARYRDPHAIVEQVDRICRGHGRADFFLTDDNFARNPLWEKILDGFISLRHRGRKISFMVEADLACGAIPRFLSKLAAAGCYLIFMGVESMNPANLRDAHKYQNQVDHYAGLWGKCHDLGMLVHAGYIIGFEHDTPQSVQADIAKLQALGVDVASFFILTPVPGSEDHVRAVLKGVPMDDDWNKYDSFQPVVDHPHMSRGQWQSTYDHAWRQFYSVPHMRSCVQRCHTVTQRQALRRTYQWWCWSIFVEGIHPMSAPFIRVRRYKDQRPGIPVVPYSRFLLQECWRYLRYAGCAVREVYRFHQVAGIRQTLASLSST